ncbi:MAG TPA: Na(+)-translocating NADH-quinone reductase subunit A [Bacteroidales bacterium]|nr:Na(+)-translocating NADH-quinone reductase subunit A [Bacteroidales bacterium]HRZ77063.1 Na(+)-translocating NADH-quinone reductase subunit A [Bacteroidales bacterium]
MTRITKLKKGLDIHMVGEASKTVRDYTTGQFAVKPTDFSGVYPKLLVREGDTVKAGSPLFFDKYREQIRVVSPVSGTVTAIKRGKQRVIEEICIHADERPAYESFGTGQPSGMDRDAVLAHMLKTGTFTFIHQLPYAIVASPESNPKSIFVSAFDTAPMAPDQDLLVEGEGEAFQTGLDALGKLTTGKVYLGVSPSRNRSKVFHEARGVEVLHFEGPHPAGNPGIQIHHTDPVNKGEVVWYLRPADVVIIGRAFLQGVFDATTLVALTGSEVREPHYVRTLRGCSIEGLVKAGVEGDNLRYISGNVLTGTRIDRRGYIGYFHNQISVIPEGNHYEFFGWALPGLGKFSVSRSYLSWLTPNKKYRLHTNLNGGHRAFVMTGEYERVLPMDIYPVHLLKAIMVEDIDLMENLGIYEVSEEDFALCEVVCTSKTPVQALLRQGLDLMRKEMS